MISLQSLLTGVGAKSFATVVLIACIAILIAAFVVGMVRGFRKVNWLGFSWLAAGGMFMLSYKLLYKVNPFKTAFAKNPTFRSFAWALTLALLCCGVVLAVYGICSATLRPKKVWVKVVETDENGFEFEDDDMDDVPVYDNPDRVLVHKNNGKPNFCGRLAGGLLCLFGAAIVLFMILSVGVLFLNATKYQYSQIGGVLNLNIGDIMLRYAKRYFFDFFTIAIMLYMAYVGYHKGFVKSTRKLLCTWGVLLAVLFGLAIPFVEPFASMYLFRVLTYRCIGLFGGYPYALDITKEGNVSRLLLKDVFGRLTAGVILAGFFVAALIGLCILLKKAIKEIKNDKVLKIVDGTVSTIVYLALGVAICFVMWSVLYLLDYCGIAGVSSIFRGRNCLANEFMKAAESMLKTNVADRYLLRWK